MKKNITVKLFMITAVFFISFISIELVFQSLFFQKFYISRKTNNLKTKLEDFEKDYVENIKDSKETLNVIRKFEENNNAKIVILESNGMLNYVTNYKDEINDTAKVSIIKSVINEWTSNPNAFINMQNEDKTITYIFDSKFYNVKNIVSINPVVVNDIPVKVIFAVSSLQPVDEAVKVMKEFYIYIYIAAVVLILVLSFIYSGMISKPLVDLNKRASNMAKLDFSEKCNVDREDEIGNLGRTLNFLSKNLETSLMSLKKSNEKLKKDIEKEKMLENMRKEFVASVSHELKTPISLIEGYAEGIKDNIVQEDDKEYYLDVIIDESQKMGRLVSDMLELSKLESGNFNIIIEEFYLDKIIDEVIKKLNGIMFQKENNKEIKIIEEVECNILVKGDKRKIEEVIMNFLTNAIRHTEKNIFVRTILEGDKVKVEIENEGKQIPEDEIEKIWDRFYKIDKSRNRKLGGTGLGLAIVKNILEVHGSLYGVLNTDIGVKFYFTLNTKQ